MSNKELVLGLLARLPEDTPLEYIAREIGLLAGLKTAREQAHCREGIPAEEARSLVDAQTCWQFLRQWIDQLKSRRLRAFPSFPRFPSFPSCTWERTCSGSCASFDRDQRSTTSQTRAFPSTTWERGKTKKSFFMNRRTKVEALPGFRIHLVYPNGTKGVIDLSRAAGRGVFTALAAEVFFRTVHIGQCGQIAWSEDIEICPDSAYVDMICQSADETTHA